MILICRIILISHLIIFAIPPFNITVPLSVENFSFKNPFTYIFICRVFF
nr:MAG TPA: hypothetical protein [Bacteriophage sp.]